MNTCKAMDYLIDANCFIESKNVTNPLDVAISFWAKIKDLALAGRIHSIDKVKTELISIHRLLPTHTLRAMLLPIVRTSRLLQMRRQAQARSIV